MSPRDFLSSFSSFCRRRSESRLCHVSFRLVSEVRCTAQGLLEAASTDRKEVFPSSTEQLSTLQHCFVAAKNCSSQGDWGSS